MDHRCAPWLQALWLWAQLLRAQGAMLCHEMLGIDIQGSELAPPCRISWANWSGRLELTWPSPKELGIFHPLPPDSSGGFVHCQGNSSTAAALPMNHTDGASQPWDLELRDIQQFVQSGDSNESATSRGPSLSIISGNI